MNGELEADIAAIRAASKSFVDQYGRLGLAIGAFQDRSLDVNGAFGFLGPSVSILNQYVKMTEDAFRGLDTLATRIDEGGHALEVTAQRYVDADTASTMHGGKK